ncbi:MAG TPA: LysE family translocator [Actinomycetes bacterium]|nr:LysE family translocator [Actinomycetes bacterium]
MPDLHTLAVFSVAALVFSVFPGPAVFYVVTRSVSQGRPAGVVSALGIELGTLVHVTAATLGLSAVLASSAAAFSVVKYLGAAYLIYLGIRTLRERGEERPGVVWDRPLRRVFANGIVVAVLNPKTALFFLAFLPQFVDPAKGSTALQIAVLGLLLVAVATVSDSAYALLSGAAGDWLRRTGRLGRSRRLVTGGAYITLGVVAALADPKPASR